jgi:hypothetical protein
MIIEQALLQEIVVTKRWIECTQEDSTYKRDLAKRIELIFWVLQNIKNPEIQICNLIESKMNELIDRINQIDDAIEADRFHSELRILDWILHQVCKNEIKKFEGIEC